MTGQIRFFALYSLERKGVVLMEPIKIQKVIDYIEDHLTEEFSYERIAAIVAVSEADLQRSFKMITGMTINEYIRYRRLSSAAPLSTAALSR